MLFGRILFRVIKQIRPIAHRRSAHHTVAEIHLCSHSICDRRMRRRRDRQIFLQIALNRFRLMIGRNFGAAVLRQS